MRRIWIQVSIGLTLSLCAFTLNAIHNRVEQLELAPRTDPSAVLALRTELGRIESRVSQSLTQIEHMRAGREKTADLDRRLETLEVELTEAASTLAQQRTKIESFEGLQDRIGPKVLDQRLEEIRNGAELNYKKLDEVARAAMGLAESTKQNLDHVESNLQRDTGRMWRDLVGPVVQLTGDETVGSGVLLASEPIDGTQNWRTRMLTAWHVVRDIQGGRNNVHVSIPVTIYTETGQIQPETATLLKYEASIDVALLELDSKQKFECGARLASRAALRDARIFEQIYAVGCPLGNDPIPTYGEIADTRHTVDGVHYWMISAPTYIGNSGGGIFDARSHELLGIFSKIYTHGSLRPTVVPHMGLVTSLETVYDWLDRVGFAGVIPVDSDPAAAEQVAAR
jgi:hypothetical protein